LACARDEFGVGLFSYLIGRSHGRNTLARSVRDDIAEHQALIEEWRRAVVGCADFAAELADRASAGEDVSAELSELAEALATLAG
jgi:hypothetical protein